MESSLRVGDPPRIGPYEVFGRLGSGGMGVVYLASGTRGTVALKLVRPEFSDDDEFRARFRREVQSSFRVQSMSVVRLVDFDTEDIRPWMAMEFIDGASLAQRVDANGVLPPQAQTALAVGLADALVAIHQQGLVHRDLKPDNVLCPIEGPKVIDLGIAAAVDGSRITSAGALVGAPGYWSPEQIQTGVASPASDVFAWGCTLAFAATGQAPFGTGPAEVMLYRVLQGAGNVDLDRLTPQLRPMVAAALRSDPAQRPTARQLLCGLLQVPDLPGDAQRRIALAEMFVRDWRSFARDRFTPTQFAALLPAQTPRDLTVEPSSPTTSTPISSPMPMPMPMPMPPPVGAPPWAGVPAPRSSSGSGQAAPPADSGRPLPAPERRPRRRALAAVLGLVLVALLAGGAVVLTGSDTERPGLVSDVRGTRFAEAVELRWTPADGASRFRISRDGRPIATVVGQDRYLVPLTGDTAPHEYAVTVLNEDDEPGFGSSPVRVAAYGPWGPAQQIADSFGPLIPTSPAVPGEAGQRCVPAGSGAEPTAIAAITCTYPNRAVHEFVRYRDPAAQRQRHAEVGRDNPQLQWFHESGAPGGLRTVGSDERGPWEYQSFYDRAAMAVRTSWPGSTEADLREWLEPIVF